jgi:uncharacterized protein involved in type VI secretion and phage assembly
MQRENGIVIGIVSDLEDPDKLGRVRVKFPYLNDQLSDWARIAHPMAGKNRGAYFVPEPEDEVLVAFECGDPRRPYVVGSLWSTADPPPATDGDLKKNNWRFIRSRSGHIIKFDDTDGGEKIEIIDKEGGQKIVIDSVKKKIEIQCGGDIAVTATGRLSFDANEVSISAKGSMSLEAKGTATLKGSTVNIN